MHFRDSQGYNCIPCQKSFNHWKNYKRHTREKHGVPGIFRCKYCDHKTKRKHCLDRHVRKQHRIQAIAASLLQELLNSIIVSCDDSSENDKVLSPNSAGEVHEDVAVEEISEYEKIRNAIVAEREAEFRRLYPTFDQDLLALKGTKPGIGTVSYTHLTLPTILLV